MRGRWRRNCSRKRKHAPGSCLLVTASAGLARMVQAEIERQLKLLSREAITRKALEFASAILVTPSHEEAIRVGRDFVCPGAPADYDEGFARGCVSRETCGSDFYWGIYAGGGGGLFGGTIARVTDERYGASSSAGFRRCCKGFRSARVSWSLIGKALDGDGADDPGFCDGGGV